MLYKLSTSALKSSIISLHDFLSFISHFLSLDMDSKSRQALNINAEESGCGGGRPITGILRLRPGCKAGLVQSHVSDSKL